MRACPTYENRPLPTSVASANSVVLIKRLVRNDGNTLKKFEPSRLAFQGNPGSLEPTPIDGARKNAALHLMILDNRYNRSAEIHSFKTFYSASKYYHTYDMPQGTQLENKTYDTV